jgi:glutathione peroxidase
METLYLYYKKRGFEILAFPSNDFANQEPLENKDIDDFCKNNFVASFPIFEKSHVTGKNINPVFKFLTDKKLNGKVSVKPLWNFHKYLIDREGNVCDFFFTFTKPTATRLRKKIESLF